MRESQRLFAVLASATLVAGALAYLAKDAMLPPATHAPGPAAAPAKAQAPAGPLVVLARDGTKRDLASPTGKGLILHFWATWCGPCRDEMPVLATFVKDTKGDANVEFLAVSVDEEWKVVDAWLKERGLPDLPVALDPKGAIAGRYGLTGYPETFFIAPSGDVIQHLVGPANWGAPPLRAFAAEFSRSSGGQKAN